jgi:uncharacterized protein YggU (UPF0235/DUF167 family)
MTGTASGPALRARVAAPPVEGAANAALIRLLARTLGVAPGAVTLIAGDTGRVKLLRVAGDTGALGRALDALAG